MPLTSAYESAAGRLWGIDLLAALYGLGGMASLWLVAVGTRLPPGVPILLAVICFTLCVGLALRNNATRIAMMFLLAFAILGDGILIIYHLAALFDLLPAPSGHPPARGMATAAMRAVTALSMFQYLRREDVREAFGGT